MISKKDVENYLAQILAIELGMKKGYERLYLGVKSPEYKKYFQRLSKEENDHANLVKELQDLLKNWK